MFCSSECADKTCYASDCYRSVLDHRLVTHDGSDVSWASQTQTKKFDSARYCTIACAHRHFREDPVNASWPIVTCVVCRSDKELKYFVHDVFPKKNDAEGHPITRPRIPPNCQNHIMPERDQFRRGFCLDCIKEHLKIRLIEHGAQGLRCIAGHDPPEYKETKTPDDTKHADWRFYIGQFYPNISDRRIFHIDALSRWFGRYQVWKCPGGCRAEMVIVEPAATPGYPHVHCPTCEKRFCATCYVPWHERISCQQYRATHPHLKHPDVNSNVLSTLAELGARRCPQCRTPGIKGEGCSHQVCLCGFIFRWNEAELVVAPEDTTAEDPANASRDGDGGEAAQRNDSVSTNIDHERGCSMC